MEKMIENEAEVSDDPYLGGWSLVERLERSGGLQLQCARSEGTILMETSVDNAGAPTIRLLSGSGIKVIFGTSDQRATLVVDRSTISTSILLSHAENGSGVIFIDQNGTRRVNVQVYSNGGVRVQRFGLDGQVLP